MKKTKFWTLASIMFLAISMMSCDPKDKPDDKPDEGDGTVAVTGVTLSGVKDSLEIDNQFTLTATVLPDSATNKNVTWTSSSNTIATVVDGVVTGVSLGRTTITVTTEDGNHQESFQLTVFEIPLVEPLNWIHVREHWGEYSEVKYRLIIRLSNLPHAYWNGDITNPKFSPVDREEVRILLGKYLLEKTLDGEPVYDEHGNLIDDVSGLSGAIAAGKWPERNFPEINHSSTLSLGVVSFKSSQTWKIGHHEWSDVVMASGCNKETFDGGSLNNINADCRTNPGYGDLFTWAAAVRYQDQLCPAGWRLPSAMEYTALQVHLQNDDFSLAPLDMIERFLSDRWGGTLGGACYLFIPPGGTIDDPDAEVRMVGQTTGATYWNQTYQSGTYQFRFNVEGEIRNGMSTGTFGNMIRCVR
jgi:uncharacterized protein (TIGR02145 family)